jgi:DNA-binding NarL/FixJ family response regulator
MQKDLHVLLVDDDWTVRSALTEYLTNKQIAVTAADAYESALTAATATQFDAAIMDIVLPQRTGERAAFRDNTGLDVARDLRRRQPGIGIIFLSAYVDRGPEVVQMYMQGHENIVYLAKGSKPADLMDALHRVAREGLALELGSGIQRTRDTAFALAWKTLSPLEQEFAGRSLARVGVLSEGEQQVFGALGMCLHRREVAARLHVTPKAVDYHINNLYDKLLLHELPAGFSPSSLLVKIFLLAQLEKAEG